MLELASVDFWQMWVVLAGVIIAIVFYCWDRFAIEVVSASVLVSLMAFFHFFPLETGNPSATDLLAGFANPALITILALLIVGQGISRPAPWTDRRASCSIPTTRIRARR